MADDEDAIYVDVVPRLDDSAADEVAGKLRDKFKDASKTIGDALKDTIGNEFGNAAKDWGRQLRDEVRSGDFHGALDDISHAVSGTTGLVTGLGNTIGLPSGWMEGVDHFSKTITDAIRNVDSHVDSVTNKINIFKDGLEGFKSGDIATGIKDVSEALRGIAPDNILDHTSGVLDVYSNAHDTIKNTIKDVTDTALELRAALGLGELGTGLGATLAAGAGEFVIPAAASFAILGPGGVSDRVGTSLFNRYARQSLYGSNEFSDRTDRALGGLPPAATAQAPMDIGSLPSFAPLDMPDDPRNPSNSPRSAPTPTFASSGTTSTGTADVRAQSAVVSTGSAVISAASLSLGGLSLPTPQVIVNAAGGGAAVNSSPGVPGASGGDPYSRAMSGLMSGGSGGGVGSFFRHRSSGGLIPGSSPGYDNLLGNVGGTPIGLEGGEFIVNPEATQNNLGLLHAINGGGMMGFDSGGGPIDQILGGGTNIHNQSPGGVQGQKPPGVQGQSPGGIRGQLPQGVMPGAPQPQKSADEPNPPQTIIPQGQGPGFSISGGALGTAESAASQAAGMAADFFAPGSGAAASQVTQIATQEMNRAIQYGVKAGVTLGVEAPLDTFWLSDSGLSDPSHSWFGKAGLNLIGQTGSAIQNLAGQTQAPLTPGQGQGQSPLGGKGQQPGGPAIHIENQYNNSDVDHEGNNRSLVNQMNSYANY